LRNSREGANPGEQEEVDDAESSIGIFVGGWTGNGGCVFGRRNYAKSSKKRLRLCNLLQRRWLLLRIKGMFVRDMRLFVLSSLGQQAKLLLDREVVRAVAGR
jgi:hypothetical protein